MCVLIRADHASPPTSTHPSPKRAYYTSTHIHAPPRGRGHIMSLYTVYPPQKDPPAPVHARAYETAQQLLSHSLLRTYIESRAWKSFQQPSAVRPATGTTNTVAHPIIRGFKQPCRPPRYWLDELCRPPEYPLQGCCQNDVHPKIALNPRQIMTRLPPRCRTSIIQSSALVQASFSLSTLALAPRSRRLFPSKIHFGHFLARVFHALALRASKSDACTCSTREQDSRGARVGAP